MNIVLDLPSKNKSVVRADGPHEAPKPKQPAQSCVSIGGMTDEVYAQLINSTANRVAHRLSDAAAVFISEVEAIVTAIDEAGRERLPAVAKQWTLPLLSDLKKDAVGAAWAVDRLRSFTDGELLERPTEKPRRKREPGKSPIQCVGLEAADEVAAFLKRLDALAEEAKAIRVAKLDNAGDIAAEYTGRTDLIEGVASLHFVLNSFEGTMRGAFS